MIKLTLRTVFALAITTILAMGPSDSETNAQGRKPPGKHSSVCGNPTVSCKTEGVFQAYDLPFRLPRNAVIYDTELFYAVILKSVNAPDDNCDAFVPETERLAAQALFPDHKVFASRCVEPGGLSYSNTSPKAHFMALYGGTTLTEANRMLAAVKAAGKFPAANIRRMRATMNGT